MSEKPSPFSLTSLVDTHAHICDPSFDHDRSDMLSRAGQSGISAIIAVGENLGDARKNIALAGEFPILRPGAGLYPALMDMTAAKEMTAFIRENRPHIRAIGEVGLDFWIAKEGEGPMAKGSRYKV